MRSGFDLRLEKSVFSEMGNPFSRFKKEEEEKKQDNEERENEEEEEETPRYLRLIWICFYLYLPRNRMVSTSDSQLFVGNLPHRCLEDDLIVLFGKFGKVGGKLPDVDLLI